ncbi:hypothetical protein NS389_05510 [Pantoea dispersa]|nr:hypothetical protein NS389_05510 [Pantoea dispersa]KTS58738.1 hypothetical protein NS380_09855 [Pantoea dispersa]
MVHQAPHKNQVYLCRRRYSYDLTPTDPPPQRIRRILVQVQPTRQPYRVLLRKPRTFRIVVTKQIVVQSGLTAQELALHTQVLVVAGQLLMSKGGKGLLDPDIRRLKRKKPERQLILLQTILSNNRNIYHLLNRHQLVLQLLL